MALADLLEIRDLETEDLLPQPTDAEVDAAAHHLADLPAPALDGADTLDRPESGRMPPILDLFFGTAAPPGLPAWSARQPRMTPAVSNAPLADSVSMGSRGDTDQPLAAKEAEIMDKNDMQPAMDEFFGPDAQPTSSAPQHIGAQGDSGRDLGRRLPDLHRHLRHPQPATGHAGLRINISQEQLMQEA
jgi:hypothetical protein